MSGCNDTGTRQLDPCSALGKSFYNHTLQFHHVGSIYIIYMNFLLNSFTSKMQSKTIDLE